MKFNDRRYVYSAGCTFHGSIDEIGTKGPHNLPCCPSCGSMLFEMPTKEKWDALVEDHAKKKNDPQYPVFVKWFGALRPCRRFRNQADFDALRAEFNSLPPSK